MQHIVEGNRRIYNTFYLCLYLLNLIKQKREKREKKRKTSRSLWMVRSDSCRISIRPPIIFKRKNEVKGARRDRRRGKNVRRFCRWPIILCNGSDDILKRSKYVNWQLAVDRQKRKHSFKFIIYSIFFLRKNPFLIYNLILCFFIFSVFYYIVFISIISIIVSIISFFYVQKFII